MIMNKPRANVHFRLHSLALYALLACLVAAPLSGADDKSVKEKQLKTLLHKIEKLKKTIDVKEDSKSRYIKQLKTIERSVGKVNLKIRRIDDQIRTKKAELAALRATRLEHQRRLSRENEYLAQQVYSAFTLGHQEKVKLLF